MRQQPQQYSVLIFHENAMFIGRPLASTFNARVSCYLCTLKITNNTPITKPLLALTLTRILDQFLRPLQLRFYIWQEAMNTPGGFVYKIIRRTLPKHLIAHRRYNILKQLNGIGINPHNSDWKKINSASRRV